jgi:hypothetical protein
VTAAGALTTGHGLCRAAVRRAALHRSGLRTGSRRPLFALAFFTRHTAGWAPAAVLLGGVLDPVRRRRMPAYSS